MAQNLAEKYSSKLDQVFTAESYTDNAVDQDYDFDGVQTVKAYSIETVDFTDYNKTGTGDRYGGNNEVNDVVHTYTVKNDKGFKLVLDAGNRDASANAKRSGEILRAQIAERYVPMVDKNRLAAIAKGATAVNQMVEATADALDDFLSANIYLTECQAPVANRYAAITPIMYKKLKKEIITQSNAPKNNDELLTKGFVGEIDGVKIIVVPTAFMPEKTTMLIWHKKAVLGVNKRKSLKIIKDSETVDGEVICGRVIFETFISEAKKKAVAGVKTK